ncbi:MAG: phosphoribosylanthranilate isomerase [Rectinemataceae bacterium]|jgi:phosphoribosylanthranilate isomerase
MSVKIKVKICGITNLEDAGLALSLGADELGFVLAPSPRRVEPETVRAIVAALKGNGRLPEFRAVGVFVNEKNDAMRDIISFAGLDAAQIHGDENPAACAAFEFPWYRALRIASVADAHRLVAAGWDCPRILVDARVQTDAAARGSYGGTGSSIGTWAAIAAGALARERGKEYFVAGGVKARSAASFIHSLGPDGLDVSSGVEEAPGRKSREKLEALFRAIRGATSNAKAEETEHATR